MIQMLEQYAMPEVSERSKQMRRLQSRCTARRVSADKLASDHLCNTSETYDIESELYSAQ